MNESIRKKFIAESLRAEFHLKTYNSYIYSGPAIMCRSLEEVDGVFSVPVISTRDFGRWIVHPDDDAEEGKEA